MYLEKFFKIHMTETNHTEVVNHAEVVCVGCAS